MIKHSIHDKIESALINATLSCVDTNKILPEMVFVGNWHKFLFCESDHVFSADFSDTLSKLLDADKSDAVGMVNIGMLYDEKLKNKSSAYIARNTINHDYSKTLNNKNDNDEWIYRMDRYILSPSSGNWCIYCERINEICIISVKEGYDFIFEKIQDGGIWLGDIKDLIAGGGTYLFPFNKLIPEWRSSLIKNYS